MTYNTAMPTYNGALEQLWPVLVYIQSHLDENLSLARVAAESDLSPFYFHRVFHRAVGETLKEYTQRLRLEKAAYYLKIQDATILDIALKLGFTSHAAFTRAFKRWFGITPSHFRHEHRRMIHDDQSRRLTLNKVADSYNLSRVTIQKLAPLVVVFIRHLGSYVELDTALYDRLISWADARGLYHGDNLLIGVGHDDPNITPTTKTRFDVCLMVTEEVSGAGEVGVQTLPGGYFATASYVGPYGPTMLEAYAQIFAQLSSRRDVEIVGLPAVEVYRTTRINPAYELNHTDIYLPVRKIDAA